MQLRILALGTKMPEWVNEGFHEYSERFPKGWSLELLEIPIEKRVKNADVSKLIISEGEKILKLIKPADYVIALDVKGQSWSTTQLANQLQTLSHQHSTIDFLIGGPDGLSEACLKKANVRLSLSALTLPHPLVRIMIAEQLYRAWSLLNNHPYHR